MMLLTPNQRLPDQIWKGWHLQFVLLQYYAFWCILIAHRIWLILHFFSKNRLSGDVRYIELFQRGRNLIQMVDTTPLLQRASSGNGLYYPTTSVRVLGHWLMLPPYYSARPQTMVDYIPLYDCARPQTMVDANEACYDRGALHSTFFFAPYSREL